MYLDCAASRLVSDPRPACSETQGELLGASSRLQLHLSRPKCDPRRPVRRPVIAPVSGSGQECDGQQRLAGVGGVLATAVPRERLRAGLRSAPADRLTRPAGPWCPGRRRTATIGGWRAAEGGGQRTEECGRYLGGACRARSAASRSVSAGVTSSAASLTRRVSLCAGSRIVVCGAL